MDKFRKKYTEEAIEILVDLERLILNAEKNENADSINEIFRLIHTLKGGGAMFGFDTVADISHKLENIFDLVRNKEANITKELLDATLDTIDYVRLILKNDKSLKKINHKKKLENIENLRKKITNESKESKDSKKTKNKKIKSYKIFFKLYLDNGIETISLLEELTEIGHWQIFAISDNPKDTQGEKYNSKYLSWLIILVTDDQNAIDDVFIFIDDESVDVELIAPENVFENEKFVERIPSFIDDEIKKLGKIHSKDLRMIKKIDTVKELKEIKDLFIDNNEEEEEFLEKNESEIITSEENKLIDDEIEDEGFGLFDEDEDEESNIENSDEFEMFDENSEKKNESDIIVETKTNFIENNEINTFEKQKNIKEDQQDIDFVNKTTTISSLRVSSKKVDTLMNLVSELITTQARLSVFVENQPNPELEAITENLQKLSKQLRDNAFELSVLPLQTVVVRFQRLIRDLSQQFNKNVEFKTKGTSTELDKRIIENLIDPILHLIRNCIDHGIETVEERKKLDKDEVGIIFLKAYYSGTNVFLQVGDDGRGINVEKIKKSAIKKGFLSNEIKYSKEEIIKVIFEPGFTTAETISEISGRGVGLDVVRRTVADLRGEITVDTKKNEGTTFTIKLPLTLSIIDGLLVEIGKEKYVIPMNIISKIYEIKHQKLAESHYNILELDNQQIPYFYLREEFKVKMEVPKTEQVLVVFADNRAIGIVVDRVIGENQAVLKPLGKMYKDLQIFSGATILGDGTVALVMDVFKIAEQLD